MTVAPKNEPKWLKRCVDFLKENDDSPSFHKKCDVVYRKMKRNWTEFKQVCDREKAAKPKKERKPRKPNLEKTTQKVVEDYGKAMELLTEQEDVNNAEESITNQLLQLPQHLVEKLVSGAVESGLVTGFQSSNFERENENSSNSECETSGDEHSESGNFENSEFDEGTKIKRRKIDSHENMDFEEEDENENQFELEDLNAASEEWKAEILNRAQCLYEKFENKVDSLEISEKQELQQSVQQLYEIIKEMTLDTVQ